MNQDIRDTQRCQLRFISATALICWLVLGIVALIMMPFLLRSCYQAHIWIPITSQLMTLPGWAWMLVCILIGGTSFFEGQWHIPRGAGWAILIAGMFLLSCLVIAAFFIPTLNLPAPLVDR